MPQTLQKQCVFRKRKSDNPAYLLAVKAGESSQAKNSLFGNAPVEKPEKFSSLKMPLENLSHLRAGKQSLVSISRPTSKVPAAVCLKQGTGHRQSGS